MGRKQVSRLTYRIIQKILLTGPVLAPPLLITAGEGVVAGPVNLPLQSGAKIESSLQPGAAVPDNLSAASRL